MEPAQAEGTLRADLEPVELLRLGHGVTTASEPANEPGPEPRRYLRLLTEGLRPAASG